MDFFPLWNSLRIAAVSSVIVFFAGIFCAYYIARLPGFLKGLLDVALTLPMVLPPTVCGYFLLVIFGAKRPLGMLLAEYGIRFTMTWYGGILASVVVAFPLMYRTARGAFESFDNNLACSGQTLGLSNTFIFWRIRMPVCRQGIIAGVVLAFARALGEYGATSMLIGYTPGRTATISTTVYQLWRTNATHEAFVYVMINIAISMVVLLVVNTLETKEKKEEAADMSLFVDIEKDYEDFRLAASFETDGGVTGLLGASGSGKSLTLRCIAGIEQPDRGKIVLNGIPLFDSDRGIHLPPQKRRVGYLFQNYALFPNMTVEQNILCGLCREKDKSERKRQAREMMGKMMLTGLEKRKPYQLSGGQQQRTALARILVSRPDILLLDEPFSALDSFLRVRLQTEMKALLSEYEKDVILVTHDRDEAYRLSRRLMVMGGGSILRNGEIKEVFRHPRNRETARLTGCKNIAKAQRVSDYEVYVPKWKITLKCAEKVENGLCAVGIRAHYFSADTPDNRKKVILDEVTEEPFEWIYKFRFSGADGASEPVWWRITKEKKMPVFPEIIGVSPQNIMLLYE